MNGTEIEVIVGRDAIIDETTMKGLRGVIVTYSMIVDKVEEVAEIESPSPAVAEIVGRVPLLHLRRRNLHQT